MPPNEYCLTRRVQGQTAFPQTMKIRCEKTDLDLGIRRQNLPERPPSVGQTFCSSATVASVARLCAPESVPNVQSGLAKPQPRRGRRRFDDLLPDNSIRPVTGIS